MVPSPAIAAEAPRKSLVVKVHFSRGDAGPEYSLLRVCCKSWPNIGHAVVASALGEGGFPFLIFELGAHASTAMAKSSNANSCFMSGPSWKTDDCPVCVEGSGASN